MTLIATCFGMRVKVSVTVEPDDAKLSRINPGYGA